MTLDLFAETGIGETWRKAWRQSSPPGGGQFQPRFDFFERDRMFRFQLDGFVQVRILSRWKRVAKMPRHSVQDCGTGRRNDTNGGAGLTGEEMSDLCLCW